MKKKEAATAFFLARKNISRNFRSLSFTILIIALGFISSIIIYGVLRDAENNLQKNYIETSMGHIVLEPYEKSGKIENSETLLKKVRTIPTIIGAAAITKKSARFYDPDSNYVDSEIYVINPREFSEVSVVDDLIKEGTFLREGRSGAIVIGCVNLENCNDIKAFDRINVGVGENVISVFDLNHQANLTLQGVYDHVFIQAEMISYINQETAQEIFEDYDADTADMILITLPSRDQVDSVMLELSQMNLETRISGWQEKSTRYSSIISSFLIVGDLSFLIGVIISAISIYVVLYINILNKRAQIGIIRAIGIRSRVISLSYIYVSLFLGIIGSILGILLTQILIQFFIFNPIKTGIGPLIPNVAPNVFLIVSLSITIASVISGYFVSKKVIKHNIIEAISNG